MKVIFLRHLPTSNNLNNIFIGHLDLECDRSYADSFDFSTIQSVTTNIQIVFTSPLKRAIKTAQLVFPNKNIIIDNRLIERDLGEWSNRSKAELRNTFPEAFYDNGKLKFSFTPLNGENFEDLIRRVASFIAEAYSRYKDETISVVTHNGIITTVKCIEKKGFKETRDISFQPYLEPYILEVNEKNIDYIYDLEKGRFSI